MGDGIGWAEALLGLDGFRVLEVAEGADELVVRIETTSTVVGCSGCGVRAEGRTGRSRRCGICRVSGGRCGWCG
jgi:hypothetical protein